MNKPDQYRYVTLKTQKERRKCNNHWKEQYQRETRNTSKVVGMNKCRKQDKIYYRKD